ncbi:hypothetical protein B0T17DRAFT_494031 [Bombardia bombarda]|uniref:Polyprenal reductase n=1 Tax=Bombardia bombarda TaxID=252184 RepID=A0AA40C1D0_9PEZI|nr:hypothetical protein B0T17DRAFT_494031 [Bombardia bombarda]
MEWAKLLEDSITTLHTVEPSQWCQAFYLFAAGCVVVVAATPREARTLLMDYGARKSSSSHKENAQQNLQNPDVRGRVIFLVATVASWGQVPHSWFSAFYLVSLACSLFWLVQYLAGGAVLHAIVSQQASAPGPSATIGQVVVAWSMMFLQGSRRVYEHALVFRRSNSKMWIVHWVLGLGFYLFTSVSIWVEGSRAVLDKSIGDTDGFAPLIKIFVAIPVFLFAWVNQYKCHKHLAGLKKYSMPDEGLFRRLVCPHYTCECLLYLSMTIVAAPEGQLCNKTLLCALTFVSVNLGVTASGTRKWYVDKFGIKLVVEKWNMIPFVF